MGIMSYFKSSEAVKRISDLEEKVEELRDMVEELIEGDPDDDGGNFCTDCGSELDEDGYCPDCD